MFNYYWISIKGKDLKRIVRYLISSNIDLKSVKYKKDNVLIKISYNDYLIIKKLRTSYDISIFKVSGSRKVLLLYSKYRIVLLFFVMSIFFILFISRFILFIRIDSDNTKLKSVIRNELSSRNITLFSLKKDYASLNKISNSIKNSNLDLIDWIEISQDGAILNVKVIERVKSSNNNYSGLKDIVASKDGYIRKIYSSNGQIMKNIDDYVRSGEVIISGNIFRNDKVVGRVNAKGKVYAEVWYITKVNKSLYYNYLKENDRGRVSLVLSVNGKNIYLISVPKRNVFPKKYSLFRNDLLSIDLKYEKKYSLEKRRYSDNDLKRILEIMARKEVNKNLRKDEYILLEKTLKKYTKNGKMYMEVFFKCYEDIAVERDIQNIEEKKEE